MNLRLHYVPMNRNDLKIKQKERAEGAELAQKKKRNEASLRLNEWKWAK